MPRWKTRPGIGFWLGLLLLVAALAGAVYFALRVVPVLRQSPAAWPVDLGLYGEFIALIGLLLLSGVCLYRLVGALMLSYEMDRNGCYVRWNGNRMVIPLAQIESIDSGERGSMGWNLLNRVGFSGGRGRLHNGRPLHLFTTRSLANSLIIHTPDAAYAISPIDQDSFVQELEQRRRLGAVKPLAAHVETGRLLAYTFWNDQVARWAFVAALVLNVLLLGILAWQYPHLADTVEMRFDAVGQGTEQRPRHQVLFLPMAALVVSLLNAGLGISLYQRDKTSTHLLQFGSVLVQLLFGVALLTIITT